MSARVRNSDPTAPTWKSWFVLASLLTDPAYLSYRLRRRWARATGRIPPGPTPMPAPEADTRDALASLEVDLVYLWVSGQDPKHHAKRAEWVERCGLPPSLFNPDVRYVEEDELRYSLRSADAFVPWVRKIFIVTDEQVPPWLDRDHPKIRIVDHREIIDAASLPTFNTKVIINRLHRIPGLGEHFLYTNDDCFFGQPCRKTDFFARRQAGDQDRIVMKIMFPQGEKNFDTWIVPAHLVRQPLARLWMASYNSLKVLLETRRRWGRIRYVDSHQTQPMIKAELAAATEEFPAEYRRTAASRFRCVHDISFISVARYRSLHAGTAVQGFVPHAFFPFESDLTGYTRDTLPALFCINAGLGDESLRNDRILARLFPEPSAWELQPAPASPR